jgi:hypothetical protein
MLFLLADQKKKSCWLELAHNPRQQASNELGLNLHVFLFSFVLAQEVEHKRATLIGGHFLF